MARPHLHICREITRRGQAWTFLRVSLLMVKGILMHCLYLRVGPRSLWKAMRLFYSSTVLNQLMWFGCPEVLSRLYFLPQCKEMFWLIPASHWVEALLTGACLQVLLPRAVL